MIADTRILGSMITLIATRNLRRSPRVLAVDDAVKLITNRVHLQELHKKAFVHAAHTKPLRFEML